jgi:hypothetical protein
MAPRFDTPASTEHSKAMDKPPVVGKEYDWKNDAGEWTRVVVIRLALVTMPTHCCVQMNDKKVWVKWADLRNRAALI